MPGSLADSHYLDLAPHEPTWTVGAGPLPTCHYMIVGLSPSPKRPIHRALEPIGAKAVRLIESLRKHVNGRGDLQDTYITNLVKEPMGSGAKIAKATLREHWGQLKQEIEIIQPDRILTLGAQTAEMVIGSQFTNLSSDHGTWFPIDLGNQHEAVVIPTFHPKTWVMNPMAKTAFMRDIQRFYGCAPIDAPKPWVAPKWDQFEPLFSTGEQVILDIETTGLEASSSVTAIGLLSNDNEAAIPMIYEHPSIETMELIGKHLYEQECIVIGHNLAFDLSVLMNHEWGHTNYWEKVQVRDTMLLAHNEGRQMNLRLKHLGTMYTDYIGPHAYGSWDSGPEALQMYLSSDLVATQGVYKQFQHEYDKYSGQLMSDLAPLFAQIRNRGVYYDRDVLEGIAEEVSDQLAATESDLEAYAHEHGMDGLNWNSSQQVVQLALKSGVPLTEKTPSGSYTMKESVLLELHDEGHDLATMLLAHRQVSKLWTGFVHPFMENTSGLIHPSLRLHGTVTGRLSCRNPNLQQIPRQGRFKTIFSPRWGKGLYGLVDLSQAELRVAALLSQDIKFRDALLSEDVHESLARIYFGHDDVNATERKAGKSITFGLLYGGTPSGLSARSGISVKRVERALADFYGEFPTLAGWLKGIEDYITNHDVIHTLFGRSRDLAALKDKEGISGAYRKAVNTPVQSVASDIMLTVIREVWQHLLSANVKSQILFGVHDSLLLEVYPGEEGLVAEAVQRGFNELHNTPLNTLDLWGTIPLTGELVMAPNWAACESTSEFYDPTMEWDMSSDNALVSA